MSTHRSNPWRRKKWKLNPETRENLFLIWIWRYRYWPDNKPNTLGSGNYKLNKYKIINKLI